MSRKPRTERPYTVWVANSTGSFRIWSTYAVEETAVLKANELVRRTGFPTKVTFEVVVWTSFLGYGSGWSSEDPRGVGRS